MGLWQLSLVALTKGDAVQAVFLLKSSRALGCLSDHKKPNQNIGIYHPKCPGDLKIV